MRDMTRGVASRLGIPEEEYRAHVAAGEKWCSGCKAWHERSVFKVDASRNDGLAASCPKARLAHYEKTKGPPQRRGRLPGFIVPARDGDKIQARRRVNHAIAAGRLKSPNELPCTDCGHVYQDGERRHEYDHHLGYGAEHHLDVQAVCTSCHAQRGWDRGEFPRERGSAPENETT